MSSQSLRQCKINSSSVEWCETACLERQDKLCQNLMQPHSPVRVKYARTHDVTQMSRSSSKDFRVSLGAKSTMRALPRDSSLSERTVIRGRESWVITTSPRYHPHDATRDHDQHARGFAPQFSAPRVLFCSLICRSKRRVLVGAPAQLYSLEVYHRMKNGGT